MHYERLLILVGLAALSSGGTLAALASLPARAWLQRTIARQRPRARARMLFALRIAPFAAGIVASIGVALAFVRHEPRQTTEEAGTVLLALTAWAIALASLGTWRLCVSLRQTARCHRHVCRAGHRIEIPGFPLPVWRVATTFPVAAISGVLRPRLILSGRVLDECSSDELLAILRHERAHVGRRDNLVRAFLLAVPDPAAFLRGGDALAGDWREAVEEAADDEAAGANPASRLALAGALVRVGRMATEAPPAWMPALALFDGDNLERRVRRLLDPEAPTRPRYGLRRVSGVLLGMLTAGAAVWTVTGPRPLHDLVEWAVRNLP